MGLASISSEINHNSDWDSTSVWLLKHSSKLALEIFRLERLVTEALSGSEKSQNSRQVSQPLNEEIFASVPSVK